MEWNGMERKGMEEKEGRHIHNRRRKKQREREKTATITHDDDS